jgi:hypothetical protein
VSFGPLNPTAEEVMPMPKKREIPAKFLEPTKQTSRAYLSMDALLGAVRTIFSNLNDHRHKQGIISLSDALMSALAMFLLKDPSLLAFDNRRQNDVGNLERIFGIRQVPCDTQMRDILDPVEPKSLRPAFLSIFNRLQRGGALKLFTFLEGHYLLSIDGTGTYSSNCLSSPACMTKVRKDGTETYYQQLLAASIVHPNLKTVIPLFPEMIQKQDGATKNDCERNAARRLIGYIREDHPNLKIIVVEDGLSSNGPHIRDLQEHNLRFILGVKPGDHDLLFRNVKEAVNDGTATTLSMEDPDKPWILHTFTYLNNTPLNQANADLMVNFFIYEEHNLKTKKTTLFSWVTDITITNENVYTLMRGARARWKVENETFNTLKNQGYNLEHNYGLGQEHLSEMFVMIMMLAFLIDQSNQITSTLFQAALQKTGSKRALWEQQRNLFHSFELDSLATLYIAIVNGFKQKCPDIYYSD